MRPSKRLLKVLPPRISRDPQEAGSRCDLCVCADRFVLSEQSRVLALLILSVAQSSEV